MDLKNKNKATNIIFSILIIVLLVLPLFGFLPIASGKFLSFYSVFEIRVNGAVDSRTYLIDVWDYVSETLKNFQARYDYSKADALYNLFSCIGVIGATFGCGIFYVIWMIKALIKTIQGFAMPVESNKITKYLIRISASIVVYVGVMTTMVFTYSPLSSFWSTMSWQLIIDLIVAGCLFAVCAILHISEKNEKKLASKILETVVAALALGLGCIYLLFNFSLTTPSSVGRFSIFQFLYFGLPHVTVSDKFTGPSIGALFGMAIIIAAFVFLSLIAQAAYGANSKDDKKKDNFAKSLIVKSALFLGLNLIGSIILFICLKVADEGSTEIPALDISFYIAYGLSAVFLAVAIANKAILNNAGKEPALEPAPAPVEEKKPESQPEPTKVETKAAPAEAEPKQRTDEQKVDDIAQKIVDTLEKMNKQNKK